VPIRNTPRLGLIRHSRAVLDGVGFDGVGATAPTPFTCL